MMRVCDSCRSAPGAVYCQADAAVLCAACDAEVHSANLISHRHHRVPVIGIPEGGDEDGYKYKYKCNEDVGISSYASLFGEEVDEYLDLGDFNTADADDGEMEMKLKPGMMTSMSFQCSVKSEVSEVCVVPVQEQEERKDYELEFGYPASFKHGPWKQSVSSPDTTLTGVSNHPHIRPSKGTIELFSGPPIQVPTQFSPMDREARVLRYREKKKMRKFEKTIRYASRKAYAEVRPRIKGRFAKRSEVELEVDQMFSNYIVPEDSYGIVPSFQNW